MYNDNYCVQPRQIPLVAFYKKKSSAEFENYPYVFTDAHYHSDAEFIFIESGKGEFYVNGQKFRFSPGNIFLINPYELHYAVAWKQYDLAYYCIDFDMKILLGIEPLNVVEKYISGERKFEHFCEDSPAIARKIMRICREYEKDEAGWSLEAKGNLFLIFAEMERKKIFHEAERSKDVEQIWKVYDFIENEYAANITSRDAAAQLGYNHSYFCRMFKRNFGDVFGEFLNHYRIKKARELMENGADKVSDIAVSVGFNNLSYFSEYFKRITGLTPTQYMKMCKNI